MSFTAYEFSMGSQPPGRKPKSRYQLQLEEKRELLSLSIRQKWGVLPSEMFPADSCHRPRVWTLTILEELNTLAGIASLEQVTGIFERVPGPITKDLISGAIDECLRGDAHTVSPLGKSPKIIVKKAEDVVFVATREGTTLSHQSPSRYSVPRTNSVAAAGGTLTHEKRQQCGLTRRSESISGHSSELAESSTPSNKRRKIQDQPPLEILSHPTPPDSADERPRSPARFEINVPFRFDDAPQFTEYISSFIQWGRKNLEEEYAQQSRIVNETTSRLASLRVEEARLNTALEKATSEQDETMDQITKFEEIMKSLLNVEEQQDRLAGHAEQLEAKKCEITRSNNLLTSSLGPSRITLRKSQKWSIELRYLKHRLALTAQDRDEILVKLETAKSNIVMEARQLEEDTEALRRADVEVKPYRNSKALSKVIANGLEKAGLSIDDAQ
ncbi:hypothetical protein F4678DRAFT_228424 [Xylaria arbuscula]|nr:hypothetical protein F4678DRAFT_228424 [Xylaria arbuscula]